MLLGPIQKLLAADTLQKMVSDPNSEDLPILEIWDQIQAEGGHPLAAPLAQVVEGPPLEVPLLDEIEGLGFESARHDAPPAVSVDEPRDSRAAACDGDALRRAVDGAHVEHDTGHAAEHAREKMGRPAAQQLPSTGGRRG